MAAAALHGEFENIVGAAGVLRGDAVHRRAAGIWRSEGIAANILVRPRSTEEVSRILATCHAAGQPVIAHGGLTGLVQGAITGPDDVVLSLERMNRIETIDEVDRTATVEAGVVLATLQERAEGRGLVFPLDLGGRGSCTIGGNIATNAGGNRVIRYGMMRELVLGLEVVLADGTVVSSMNRMIKNNAGYDLKQWFIGSEGTLGIVTRAVLRLREAPASRETLLVAAESFDAVTGLLKHVDQRLGGTLSAFEVMWNDFYVAVTTPPAKAAPPLPQHHPYYVLIEAMGGDAMADRARLEAAMSEAMAEGLIRDAVLAESESQARRLWAIRDDVEQLFRFAPLVIFDVSLPVSNMPAYLEEVRARYAAGFPDGALFVFGHLGDGNLHLVAAPGCEAREQVERIVYEPLVAVAGSISAEHGIGLEKRPYLQLCRSPAEIALMRRIKAALDPKGILNPGRILEPV